MYLTKGRDCLSLKNHTVWVIFLVENRVREEIEKPTGEGGFCGLKRYYFVSESRFTEFTEKTEFVGAPARGAPTDEYF
jgi:hypothetical protein